MKNTSRFKFDPFWIMFSVFGLIVFIFLFGIGLSIYESQRKEVITDTVIRLEKLPIISGSTTKYRYIVVCQREIFICENSIVNLKFNNSDIFFHLQEGEEYTFEVCGIGKTIMTDYRNILSYKSSPY
jgi:hypothetical protein